ncbi:MAG: flavodoxin [Tissierellia bacterium]|nr:flavodoxin [Tissierellia bacterium]
MKVNIIYWSGTGNTEAMANAIADGVKQNGADVAIIPVSDATIDDVKSVDNIAFGSPAMGSEEIEESQMRPFMDEANNFLSGKKVLLFGSYEWADGEWMEKWVDEVSDTGANLIADEGLIAYDAPDEEAIEKCINMGIELSK